jgi:hypothetical protein
MIYLELFPCSGGMAEAKPRKERLRRALEGA